MLHFATLLRRYHKNLVAMKKSILPVMAFVLLSVFARAQYGNKIAISVGGGAMFSSENSIGGPGFSADAELPLAAQLRLIFSAGYFVNYFGRRLYDTSTIYPPVPCDACGIKGPYEFIPLKAGLRYYMKQFYVQGQAGEALEANVTRNSFIYGGTLGGLIKFNSHNFLDIGFGYEHGYKFADYNEAVSEAAIRLAYRYQF
jgi:hypothetical protein